MRAVVFSGTTEGRAFSKQLGALGADVLVSVATDLGAEEQGSAPGVTVRAGRLEPEEMTALLQGADLCIDATHPYAVEATKNIRAAAAGRGWNTTACSGPPARCRRVRWCFQVRRRPPKSWPGRRAMSSSPPGPKSWEPFPLSHRSGATPGCCPPRRGLRPVRRAGRPPPQHHCDAGAVLPGAERSTDPAV